VNPDPLRGDPSAVAIAQVRLMFGKAVLLAGVLISESAYGQSRSEIAPVITIAAIQDSEGLTEADLTPMLLKRLEAWSVDASRRKMSQSFARSGQDPNLAYRLRIDSQAVLNVVAGKKLAIIRLTVDNSIREVSVMGFKDAAFYRVGCLRASNHDIRVFSGECGKIVRDTFGVSIP